MTMYNSRSAGSITKGFVSTTLERISSVLYRVSQVEQLSIKHFYTDYSKLEQHKFLLFSNLA